MERDGLLTTPLKLETSDGKHPIDRSCGLKSHEVVAILCTVHIRPYPFSTWVNDTFGIKFNDIDARLTMGTIGRSLYEV